MKKLDLGVAILEGVAALISVGIGVYQIIEIVKSNKQYNKELENTKQNTIDVQVVEKTC